MPPSTPRDRSLFRDIRELCIQLDRAAGDHLQEARLARALRDALHRLQTRMRDGDAHTRIAMG